LGLNIFHYLRGISGFAYGIGCRNVAVRCCDPIRLPRLFSDMRASAGFATTARVSSVAALRFSWLLTVQGVTSSIVEPVIAMTLLPGRSPLNFEPCRGRMFVDVFSNTCSSPSASPDGAGGHQRLHFGIVAWSGRTWEHYPPFRVESLVAGRSEEHGSGAGSHALARHCHVSLMIITYVRDLSASQTAVSGN
jgi:hypothetical protein